MMMVEDGKVKQGACICVYHDNDRADCVGRCEALKRTRGQEQLSHCFPGVALDRLKHRVRSTR